MTTTEETTDIQTNVQAEEEQDMCAICLSSLQEEGGDVRLVVRCIQCNKSFHEECIEPALAVRDRCPLCRHNFPVIHGNLTMEHGNSNPDNYKRFIVKTGKKILRKVIKENKGLIKEVACRLEREPTQIDVLTITDYLQRPYNEISARARTELVDVLLPYTMSDRHEELRGLIGYDPFLDWNVNKLWLTYEEFWELYRKERLTELMGHVIEPLIVILDERIQVQAETSMAFWKDDWKHHEDVSWSCRIVGLKNEFTKRLERDLQLALAREFYKGRDLTCITHEDKEVIEEMAQKKTWDLEITVRFRRALQKLRETTEVTNPDIPDFPVVVQKVKDFEWCSSSDSGPEQDRKRKRQSDIAGPAESGGVHGGAVDFLTYDEFLGTLDNIEVPRDSRYRQAGQRLETMRDGPRPSAALLSTEFRVLIDRAVIDRVLLRNDGAEPAEAEGVHGAEPEATGEEPESAIELTRRANMALNRQVWVDMGLGPDTPFDSTRRLRGDAGNDPGGGTDNDVGGGAGNDLGGGAAGGAAPEITIEELVNQFQSNRQARMEAIHGFWASLGFDSVDLLNSPRHGRAGSGGAADGATGGSAAGGFGGA
jgi:hypothetical protein